MAEDEGVEVTYRPGHGDPQETTWRGQRFKAGEPVRVKDVAHLDALSRNKSFHVKRDGEKPGEPKTPDGHRARFAKQIAGETTVEGVIRAFAGERKRREEADLGDDDLKSLQTQMEPTLRFMRIREGMGDRQMAELWAKYGMST